MKEISFWAKDAGKISSFIEVFDRLSDNSYNVKLFLAISALMFGNILFTSLSTRFAYFTMIIYSIRVFVNTF